MPKIVDKNKILEMYSCGASLKEIEEETKYSRTTILKHLKASNIWVSKSEQDKEILRKYIDEGKSMAQVSRETGLCRNTISYRLNVNNAEIRSNEIDGHEVVELYHSGLLISEVAKAVGCSANTVTSKLVNSGLVPDNHLLKIDDKELLDTYTGYGSLTKTAAHFRVSTHFIKKNLIKNGITVFRHKNWDAADTPEAIELYRLGMSTAKIGRKFGFSHTTIISELEKSGVQLRKKHTEAVRGSGYSKISDSFMGRIRTGASKRGLSFEVDSDFLFCLFSSQGGKCKLSGVDISLPKNYSEFSLGDCTASLDRIDSSKGYTKDNVQWLHKSVNVMKNAMSDQEFISWCRKISDLNP
jgi:lambda repressor-like predicted transcriptional regulator